MLYKALSLLLLLASSDMTYVAGKSSKPELKMVFQVSRHCTRGVKAGGAFPYLIKPGYEKMEFNEKVECLPEGKRRVGLMAEFIKKRYGNFINFD